MSALTDKLKQAQAVYQQRVEQLQYLQHQCLMAEGSIQTLKQLIDEEQTNETNKNTTPE